MPATIFISEDEGHTEQGRNYKIFKDKYSIVYWDADKMVVLFDSAKG